jgi:hypothetical protein
MDNLDEEIKKLNENSNEVPSYTGVPVSTNSRVSSLPYVQKLKLKALAYEFLETNQEAYPMMRSLNLYLSNEFGYETIKVFISPKD